MYIYILGMSSFPLSINFSLGILKAKSNQLRKCRKILKILSFSLLLSFFSYLSILFILIFVAGKLDSVQASNLH